MNDQLLLEQVQLKFQLSDDAVLAIRNLCNTASIGAAEAMLQLGIISRRQLSGVIEDHQESKGHSAPSRNNDDRLMQTMEHPIVPLYFRRYLSTSRICPATA